MSAGLVAVVDQGSTATKGAVVSPREGVRRQISRPVGRRSDGARVTHEPATLAAGVEEVLTELLAADDIEAIGLTCQRSTCLLWDRESGEPLSETLSWQDRSQRGRVEALSAHAAEVARRTGLRLSPHYAAPKLASLLEALPGGAERAAAGEIVAGTLDAFLVRGLIGVDATEPGHAGRTLLYDLEAGAWSPELCELFGVPRAALPELRTSAGDWGEYRGVPLRAVAGDQQAALIGHGGWAEGVTAAHFGTGAFVLVSTGERPLFAPGLLTAALASTPSAIRFQLEGSVNSAGSAVDWACRLTGLTVEDLPGEIDPRRLPLVLPAFAGLAAPWWRPEATAEIAGLTPEMGPERLLAGVLSGVAMRVLDCLEAQAEAGVTSRVLRVSGKLTRSAGLVGLLADAGQIPVEVAEEEETGLAGIARLAAAASGGTEAMLTAPLGTRRRREPRWSADRARAERQRWLQFVHESVAGSC